VDDVKATFSGKDRKAILLLVNLEKCTQKRIMRLWQVTPDTSG
jgi:hypothetical protein